MNHYQYINQTKRQKHNGKSVAVIRYDEQNQDAPRVVAQGRGQIANQILDMAKEHNIEMQEDSHLLANLLEVDLGEQIPPQLYSVMAEILLMIERMERET
ncbi:EscU/YscU/HrcU family type III secretion system export apparatus switch protein [Alkalihalobacillus sp. 1P02AB]|uniref:EscU/YscU/HrcU family type III secretion system export apparatus switch protein n=1 Tax=Alkalihalobacillus sp. 1P02AB TaxID=3132260 RepID=UPI0039A4CB33